LIQKKHIRRKAKNKCGIRGKCCGETGNRDHKIRNGILQANYTFRRQQVGLSVQNLFNTRWKETQFATESRLQHETAPVDEIHFTPGTPFFARLSWRVCW
jgi:hypothetical protein